MISIFTGLPRSGKTYRAVDFINMTFIDPKSKDYAKHQFLYTNIGGFNHVPITKQLENNPVITTDIQFIKETIPLDWDNLYSHLQKLHEMANKDKPDEELIRYSEYHRLSPALYVIDECYRYFMKKSDPVLVWWLAYHGHLGIDIILILQNKGLMHSDYKSFTEFFIDAQPKSKSFRPNQLRYFHYASEQYTKEQRYHTDSLTGKKEVFALYKSGDMHKPKQIIFKYIGLAVLAVVGVVVLYQYFINSMKERAGLVDEDFTEYPVTEASSGHAGSTGAINIDSIEALIHVRCDDETCWRVDERYEHNSLRIGYFKHVVINNDLTLQYTDVENEIYKTIETDRGLQKITLAYFEDYYYFIPGDVMDSYLAQWVIPIIEEKPRLFEDNDPFNTDTDSVQTVTPTHASPNGPTDA